MQNTLILGVIVTITTILVIYIIKAIKRHKEFQRKIKAPGTKTRVEIECLFTKIPKIYLHFDDCTVLNPYFEDELRNRGIAFKHLTVKDLGYTWVDKENKKGFNSYEIEYWNWD